jgi:gas vesicle protein
MSRKGDFWLGLVIGAAAGAVGALLYAPKSGNQMRREIGDAARQAGRKAGQAWGDVKDRTSEAASDVQHSLRDAADKGCHMMDDLSARMRKAIKVGRRAAEEKLEELESSFEKAKRKAA